MTKLWQKHIGSKPLNHWISVQLSLWQLHAHECVTAWLPYQWCVDQVTMTSH